MHITSIRFLVVSAIFGLAGSVERNVAAEDLPQRSQLAIGHNFRSNSAIFTPDGRTVLSGDNCGERFVFWDVESGRIQTTLSNPLLRSTVPIEFTSDGQRLICVSTHTNKIVIWNLQTQTASVLGAGMLPATLSSNRRWLAVGEGAGSVSDRIAIWDMELNQVVAKFTPPIDSTVPNGRRLAWHIAFSPDNQTVATLFIDRHACVWDLNTKQLLKSFVMDQQMQHRILFDPQGKMQTLPGKIDTSIPGKQYNYLESFTRDMCYSEDGKLVARLMIPSVRVEEVATGRLVVSCPVTPHHGHHGSVQFSPDGKQILVSDGQGPILLNVTTGEARELHRRPGDIRSLAFRPDGRQIASARGNFIELWNTESPENPSTLEARTPQVDSVAYHPSGMTLGAGHVDGSVRIWNLETRQCQKLSGHTRSVMSIAFHPDGQTLATGSFDGTIKLWNVDTTHLIRSIAAADPVRTVAFSPDGQILAAGNHAKSIELYSVSTGEKLGTLGNQTSSFLSVMFSPDGKRLATAGDNHQLYVWNITTRECETIIDFGTRPVFAVAFLPDGQHVVAATGAGRLTKIRLVDSKTETASLKTTGGNGIAVSRPWHTPLAISPDGRTAATAGAFSESVGLFDLSPKSIDHFEVQTSTTR